MCLINEAVGQEMLDRLAWMTIKPQRLLAINCMPMILKLLQKRYSETEFISLYLTENFTPAIKNDHELISLDQFLALQSSTIDLIFANLVLPWQADLQAQFMEWLRVLRPSGLMMFSALGPDTFDPWKTEIQTSEKIFLRDMHDIGDALLTTGFVDPVLDVDHFTLQYQQKNQLFEELIDAGLWQNYSGNRLNLKDIYSKMEVNEVDFEVIYGHAFVPSPKVARSENSHQISVTSLREALQKQREI